jgi:hypothetical protein
LSETAAEVHRAPEPLAASGLAVDGWVPVDQANLRTAFPHVYALGDVCTGPRTVPKAGILAEAAARVVADDILAVITGADPPAPYEGSGVCYAEFGGGLVGKVVVNFLRGGVPGRRASRSLARAWRREGRVRRDRPCAVVRILIVDSRDPRPSPRGSGTNLGESRQGTRTPAAERA